MSEVLQARAGEGPATAVDAAVQAGALLRAAREATGLHIAALAVSLKVPVQKLEALEAGRLDALPDAVFARALASSVCRTLKVDPAPVLELLPSSHTPRLRTDETGINAPFRVAGESTSQPLLSQFLRPAPVLVLLLVVGALALLFVPQLHWERDAQAPDNATQTVVVTPAAEPVAPALETPAPAAPAAASSAPAGVATAPAGFAATPSPVAAVAAVAASAAQTAASAPAAVATTGVVVFQPRGETWVQVIDANGVVALRKTLKAGETAGASGALPLAVVVGKADQTAVEVRGKTLDLATVSRDNVARFEVK